MPNSPCGRRAASSGEGSQLQGRGPLPRGRGGRAGESASQALLPQCMRRGPTGPLKRQLDPTGTAREDGAGRARPGRLPFPGGRGHGRFSANTKTEAENPEKVIRGCWQERTHNQSSEHVRKPCGGGTF